MPPKNRNPDRMCTQCLDSSSRFTAYTRCMCTRARAQRLAVSMRGSNLIPGKRLLPSPYLCLLFSSFHLPGSMCLASFPCALRCLGLFLLGFFRLGWDRKDRNNRAGIIEVFVVASCCKNDALGRCSVLDI